MNTLDIKVKYRPVRIGWCIRENNWDDLRKVLRLTHTLWGGRYNPVIPISNYDTAKQLIEAYEIDCLYPAFDDDKLFKEFDGKFPHLAWPIYNDLFVGDLEDKRASFLDVYHPVRAIHDEHVKNVSNSKIVAYYFDWDVADPLADVLLSSFGAYPPKVDTGVDYKDLLKHLNLKIASVKSDEVIDRDGWNLLTPSAITKYELQRHSFTRRSPGIYYGSASDFIDIVNFWNLRAEDGDVYFYDPVHSARLLPLLSSYLIALRQHAATQPRSQQIVAYIGEHRLAKENHAFPEDFDFGVDVNRSVYIAPIKPSLHNSGRMHFKEHSLIASVDQTGMKPSLTFQFPEKPFFDDDYRLNTQHYVISVSSFLDISAEGEWTFRVPYIPELNEYYGREVHFDYKGARVELNGIGIIQSIPDTHLTLRALRIRDLTARIFNLHELESQPSKPGLIAARLIQQMGDLQKCRVFKIRGVRKLIEKNGPFQSFTRSAAIQMIRDVDPLSNKVGFEAHESLYLKPREKERLTPEDAFTWLIEHEVFRAGLKLKCPSCDLDFWLSLDNVQANVACEYCGKHFLVTPQLRDRDWAYRRSGLFGRDDHQEGGISVAVTLQQLETVLSSDWGLIYTTACEISSKAKLVNRCEGDFVVLTRDRDGLLQIVIGECKSNARIPDGDLLRDIDNLMKIADIVSGERIRVYVLLSKTAEFLKAELAQLRSAYKKYRHPLILMSRRELEPYFIYEWTEAKIGQRLRASSLDDLVACTKKIYLEPERLGDSQLDA